MNSSLQVSTFANNLTLQEREPPVGPVYSYVEVLTLTISVGFFSVFGIFSNCITIYVIYKSEELKSVFNYFIMSLSVSDLMSALINPLYLYRRTWGFHTWKLPEFLCKLWWSIDIGTSVLTSLHIMVFSGLRLISLKYPHKFTKFTPKKAKIVIFFLWIISIGGGFIPFSMWMGSRKRIPGSFYHESFSNCGLLGLTEYLQFKMYTYVGYSLFFFAPCAMVMIFSISASMLLIVRRKERKKKFRQNGQNQNEITRQKKENQAILQLLLIVGSYLIGYLPFCIFYIDGMLRNPDRRSRDLIWWLETAIYLTLRLSEFLNPIFYNVASSQMREETTKLIKNMFPCCVTNPRPNVGNPCNIQTAA